MNLGNPLVTGDSDWVLFGRQRGDGLITVWQNHPDFKRAKVRTTPYS